MKIKCAQNISVLKYTKTGIKTRLHTFTENIQFNDFYHVKFHETLNLFVSQPRISIFAVRIFMLALMMQYQDLL